MKTDDKSPKALARLVHQQGWMPILLTDSARLPDPIAAIKALPAAGLVIVRDYDAPDRANIADTVTRAAHRAGHRVAIAADARLARRVGADGIHVPEWQLGRPPYGMPLLSCACHNRRALSRAKSIGVGLALVSPIFPTRSHPGVASLGVHRLSRLISHAGDGMDVAALGGVKGSTARYLREFGAIRAIAAIDGWGL